MMNERKRQDLKELLEYYNDMEKRIQRIQHLCKFTKDLANELKEAPVHRACTVAQHDAFLQCLEILRGYADEED